MDELLHEDAMPPVVQVPSPDQRPKPAGVVAIAVSSSTRRALLWTVRDA